MSEIYCRMIPNDDPYELFYEVRPRIGAFELSINGKLLFSKLISKRWPNTDTIVDKCMQVSNAIDEYVDIGTIIAGADERGISRESLVEHGIIPTVASPKDGKKPRRPISSY